MKSKYIISVVTFFCVILAATIALYFYQVNATATEDDKVHEHDHIKENSNHGDHNGHMKENSDHDDHDEDGVVHLSNKEIKEFSIKINTVQPGKLNTYMTFPGEIVINADRLVHIVPRISGVVQKVFKNVGDSVRSGDIVAVINSREIAEAKAVFLASRKRVELAQVTYKREENLWKQQISSEQDYLEAKQALEEARIEMNLAEQKLHNLGFSDNYISKLSDKQHVPLTRYEIRSPSSGTIIEKHITLGEALTSEAVIFIIADMSSVWVDLKIYQKDLPFVQKGHSVIISTGHGYATGKISYISPLVDEQTRTAIARVILPNSDGRWRPGIFVNGKIKLKDTELPLVVSKTAIQLLEGTTHVFVKTEKGFEPKPITTGRSDDTHIEITSGLKAGDQYVREGAFTLKSELQKKTFGEGHSH